MATVRVFGRESYDPNSKNRYYKNWDALGKVLNYMYRTGGDTENDLIEKLQRWIWREHGIGTFHRVGYAISKKSL